ncbi:MAG: formate/nitrite transporter family protein [Alphaproteobacteria bacterium]|nr:formate/nitrite transporter family protein [Alphaproteobacteria bacterium]
MVQSLDDRDDNTEADRQPVDPAALAVLSPAQIASLVDEVGVKKCALSFQQTLMLAILAGGFIAIGAMLFLVAITGSELGFGPTRLLGGAAFSIGLIAVVLGGAELFTGNNLIVMAWADGKVSGFALLRNWVLVYIGNMIGAFVMVALIHASGIMTMGDGAVAETAAVIAREKLRMDFVEAVARGVLCNVLICLAVWMCMAARRASGKIMLIVFPITAFVALGFEHSVANMFLIPIGATYLHGTVDVMGLLGNLVPVTLGNILGGGVLVGLVYWLVYGKES